MTLMLIYFGIATTGLAAFYRFENPDHWGRYDPILFALLWPPCLVFAIIAAALDYLTREHK